MEDFTVIDTLIKKWMTGGDLHFKAVFDHCYPRLLQYASQFIPDETVREELTMNVLYKIWRQKERIARLDDFNSYFFIMMRNEVVSMLRKKRHTTESLQPDAVYDEQQVPGEDIISYRELLQRYQHCLDQLPPKRREAFVLNREKGLTYAEIAAQLNISVFTVQNHIAAALRSLRSQLYDYADFLPLLALFSMAMLSVC